MSTGADGLVGRISELSPERRRILDRLLKAHGVEVDLSVIRPCPGPGPRPLSYAQQRLWFLNQIEQSATAYNCYSSWWLEGALDVGILRRCLVEIVRRHQVLRSVFPLVDGVPVQSVAGEPAVELPVIDLSGVSAADREGEALRRLGATGSGRPFDLASGPLVRAKLLRLEPTRHLFILEIHHIAFDGWSVGIFLRELALLYEAFLAGRSSPLPELPIQYADYAAWQREWLQGEVLDAQLRYWRARLAAMPTVTELPADHPRPPVPSPVAGMHSHLLPKVLSDALKELSRREGATLFMTLLATFQVLLGRYTGQHDVVVGSPIAGRHRREVESLIGFFVNNLVLRGDLSGDPTFRELLGRVREATLGAYAHQDLPFEKLVEELQPERTLSANPLFQVMFALQNAPSEAIDLPGLTLRVMDGGSAVTRFDWELHLSDSPHGLHLGSLFRKDLFEPQTLARMVSHYRSLLEDVVAHPDRRLSELQVLTAPEREQIVVEWNATGRDYPRESSVGEVFEEQVRRAPEAVAVVSGAERLSYSDLDRRANRLARFLRALGVGPEARVGICLERSPEMVVGVLGILKAGGAYVPLDPRYPRERLAFMVADAGVHVLLSQEKLRSALPRSGARVVLLDGDVEEIAGEGEGALSSGVSGEDLAYVGYTSGSTGVPKGIEIPHRGVLRLVLGADYAELGPGETLLQCAPLAFDASTLELWGALLRGGRCVLYPDEVPTARGLAEVIGREGVSTLWLTASLFNAVMDEHPGALRGLRQLLIGGEALSVPHVRRALEALPGTRIINGYGPTEATTFTCCYTIPRELAAEAESVPIGRPIANTRVYVLDEWMNPVGPGVTGELFVAGDGLARGYAGRADLTAERFIPDPFSVVGGGRLYRTGDRARYRPDGVVEFRGRKDSQVKLRGFRVEPGEVEAVLEQHPGVRACTVAVREDAPGDRRLVAYVVPEAGDEPPPGRLAGGELVPSLRAYVEQRLPAYMVPVAFVTLDSLPLTSSGKLDRRRLPAPEGRPELADAYVPPRSPVEEALVEIWRDVLSLDRVGVHDDFFELGGHSLLATRVVSRVREALRVELPVRTLFESPTVAGLAEAVHAARSSMRTVPPPIRPAPGGRRPLSFAQQRLWFLDQLEAGTAYNVPLALRLAGALDLDALERSLNEIVRRHEVLRTSFPVEDEQPAQVIAPPAPLPLAAVDLRPHPADEREQAAQRLAEEEARRGFDLAGGPLIRATLLRLSEAEHVLLLTLHHTVADGWSLGVLFRELSTLYAAFAQGRPSPLPELPVQYGDFAAWQREWFQGPVLLQQLAYWRRQLEGVVPLELPTDHPRPQVQTFRGASQPVLLPPELARQLRAFCRREGATVFMGLLAAFKALLCRCTGQTDLAVGTPIAGRGRPEVEALIGFFVNTLVLRTSLAGRPSFRQSVRRVRDVALGAYDHADLPFDKLVEELRPARDPSRSPLFQAVFALQNGPAEPLDLAGLKLSSCLPETTVTRFDLEFHWWEAAGTLGGVLVFNRDLWDPETIADLGRHFRVLLEGALRDPDRGIDELPLLESDEEQRLLVEWNATARDHPRGGSVVAEFEEQAARDPAALAVAGDRESLSYSALNRRANRVAHHLRRLGVGPEVRVGIWAGRSPDLVVGILGIAKAGGAFVPFDPGHPPARVGFMLRDSQVAILLAQRDLAPGLPEMDLRVLPIDADEGAFAGESEENPPAIAGGDDLAYVVYTSGSTGRPKGVEISHAGLRNLVSWHRQAYALTPRDRATLVAAPAFDASVWELWPYLTAGASLHIPDGETRSAPSELVRWLAREDITVSFLPTPLAEAVLQEEWPAEVRLRALLTGGDRLHGSACRNVSFPVFNHYGPTESTVVTTWAPVEVAGPGAPDPPIGRPIDNTRVYVLDAGLRPVPVGVPGELYVGGAGLARGYLGRPDLTAERFLPDPFGRSEGGGRLYRTGDRVRYRPDGNIEFLGRMDEQVKIRGFRIELGEVEAVLRSQASVKECVVCVCEDTAGDPRLVAYVVPRAGASIDRLRRHLQDELPLPMVPSAFVALPALPLSPNGKVDRRALPAPPRQAAADDVGEAPRGEAESVIAEVWAEVLGLDRVGIRDNFFDLGGHSMLLVQVHRRLQRAFPGRELPLIALFEHPTVAALAAHLGGSPGAATEAAGVVRRPEAGEGVRDGQRRLRRRRESLASLGAAGSADA